MRQDAYNFELLRVFSLFPKLFFFSKKTKYVAFLSVQHKQVPGCKSQHVLEVKASPDPWLWPLFCSPISQRVTETGLFLTPHWQHQSGNILYPLLQGGKKDIGYYRSLQLASTVLHIAVNEQGPRGKGTSCTQSYLTHVVHLFFLPRVHSYYKPLTLDLESYREKCYRVSKRLLTFVLVTHINGVSSWHTRIGTPISNINGQAGPEKDFNLGLWVGVKGQLMLGTQLAHRSAETDLPLRHHNSSDAACPASPLNQELTGSTKILQ